MNNLAESIYKTARKRAGLKREPVAEELHIDVRTLDKYESLDLKTPDDIVYKMCRLYNNPRLGYAHLKASPLGEFLPDVPEDDLKGAALSMACELDDVVPLMIKICKISSNGRINPEERTDWSHISKEIAELTAALLDISFAAKMEGYDEANR